MNLNETIIANNLHFYKLQNGIDVNRLILILRASNGARTRDIQSHNLTLYLLSYTRRLSTNLIH